MSDDAFEFRIEVPFGPRWQHVELLRISILNCLATVFQNYDFCEQLGMVTAELVENAIHYGDWHETGRPFRLSVRGSRGEVTVEVANPIDPSGANPKRLAAIVERLAHASPKEAYASRLREIAEDPGAAGSGLGLLRIAYETECKLEVVVDAPTVRVRATLRGESPDAAH